MLALRLRIEGEGASIDSATDSGAAWPRTQSEICRLYSDYARPGLTPIRREVMSLGEAQFSRVPLQHRAKPAIAARSARAGVVRISPPSAFGGGEPIPALGSLRYRTDRRR